VKELTLPESARCRRLLFAAVFREEQNPKQERRPVIFFLSFFIFLFFYFKILAEEFLKLTNKIQHKNKIKTLVIFRDKVI
jgi:hypothetical protein